MPWASILDGGRCRTCCGSCIGPGEAPALADLLWFAPAEAASRLEGALSRLRLVLAYPGTRFHGWQLQAGTARCRSAEQALAVRPGPVRAVGPGARTPGCTPWARPCMSTLPRNRAPAWAGLNALLPDDVAVVTASWPRGFHARFGAVCKPTPTPCGKRRIRLAQRRPSCGPAARWTGRHEEAPLSSRAPGTSRLQNAGTAIAARCARSFPSTPRPEPRLRDGLAVHGRRFLKQMVRNMVGCSWPRAMVKFPPATSDP